ncbi:SDR family NAD(P)-dependent oxidoreductase [Bordetella sp. 02P26C-1]|uniref:SDR family NAD(P)-dependent oxidoreductase n=1 Tax=Bordetella sp. 02P26C-1 TaxID=2683195 RepID=UPI00135308A8|nr:SDR family NAD(P)-dependent oxidoreductase [Bordetella sp. 02P26C-1]MVW78478.1 SDR family oxidoreductase [Bordetella sp. 02P26C-1]
MKEPVVVITGGASNIGWACVQNFSATHSVVIGDLKHPPQTAANVSFIETNIANPDSAAAMMRYAADLGPVEAVIHCAAITAPAKPVEEITPEEWVKVINVNLNGAFFVAQAAIPYLRETAGAMVMVASRAARTGYAALSASPSGTKPHYCASKAGVLSLVKSLAIELAPQGVRVNAVVPGSIEGTMIPKERWGELSRQIPLGRLGTPEEIAEAARFLTSPAARYITGHSLDVNGGTWMN